MKIAVFFGGTSAERDVSIASGAQIIRALRTRGHDVVAVDPATGVVAHADEEAVLRPGVAAAPPERNVLSKLEAPHILRLLDEPALAGTDVIFIALHGTFGEDGTLQALLDTTGIPYTGSGMLGSALAMDKDISKRLFRSAGVPTPAWLMAPADPGEVARAIGFPLIVKPSKQGSTVGLSVVRTPAAVDAAVEEAFRHDDEVLIEAFIAGRELTVPILAGEALPVGEIIPRHEIFDYECKYQPDMAQEIFPAELPESLAESAAALAVRAHHALKLGGYSRVDFRMDAGGGLWCLEVNTLPGMTAASLFPKGAAAAGLSFADVCERICTLALQEHAGSGRVY